MGPTALDSSINRYLEMMECFSEVTRGSTVTPKLGLGLGQPLPLPDDMPTSGTTGSQKLPASVPKGHTTPLYTASRCPPPNLTLNKWLDSWMQFLNLFPMCGIHYCPQDTNTRKQSPAEGLLARFLAG